MPSPNKVGSGSVGRILWALLLCSGATASPLQNTIQLSASKEPAVHSAPLELIHGRPYVMVTVNGQGPFRFLIDTGTGGQALVSTELAGELALPTVGHARLMDPSHNGKQRSDIVQIRSLTVAGVEFAEIRAIRHRLYGDENNCVGVLGFTLFKDYLLTLDYPGRKLVLGAGEVKEEGGSVLPFRMPDGVPIVPLRIAGQRLEAQIDSGGMGLSLPLKVAARAKFLSTPVEFGRGESLSTRFQIKAARLRPDIRVGHYTFRQAFVEINPAFPLVNIGSTPLADFVVTFDQANLRLRLHAKQRTLQLNASPTPLNLNHDPSREAKDRKLVPVG